MTTRTPFRIALAVCATVALAAPSGAAAAKKPKQPGLYKLKVEYSSILSSTSDCKAGINGRIFTEQNTVKKYAASGVGRAGGYQSVKVDGFDQLERRVRVFDFEYVKDRDDLGPERPFDRKDSFYRWVNEKNGRVKVDYEAIGAGYRAVSIPIPRKGVTRTLPLDAKFSQESGYVPTRDCFEGQSGEISGTITLTRVR
jgi:hypothetical protein